MNEKYEAFNINNKLKTNPDYFCLCGKILSSENINNHLECPNFNIRKLNDIDTLFQIKREVFLKFVELCKIIIRDYEEEKKRIFNSLKDTITECYSNIFLLDLNNFDHINQLKTMPTLDEKITFVTTPFKMREILENFYSCKQKIKIFGEQIKKDLKRFTEMKIGLENQINSKYFGTNNETSKFKSYEASGGMNKIISNQINSLTSKVEVNDGHNYIIEKESKNKKDDSFFSKKSVNMGLTVSKIDEPEEPFQGIDSIPFLDNFDSLASLKLSIQSSQNSSFKKKIDKELVKDSMRCVECKLEFKLFQKELNWRELCFLCESKIKK